jgi:hypothetical protein
MQALVLEFDGMNICGRQDDDPNYHDCYVAVESKHPSDQSHQYNDNKLSDEDIPIRSRDKTALE